MEILITEPVDFSEKAFKQLNEFGKITTGPFDRKELLRKISNTDVLVVRLNHHIDKEVLDYTKNLKYIITPTTGLNHIDVEYALTKKINIISLKGETGFLSSIPSTAEHTWALLMALVRKIPVAFEDVKNGNWNRDKFKGHNLNALTLGIFGYGRVGKQIATIAKAFKMKVLIYDKNEVDSNKMDSNEVASVNSARELFSESDILSIHLDYSMENENIVNKELLKYLPKGSYLINTSRGELLNEEDVVFYLENGSLAGVAVDVLNNETEEELRNSSPLLEYARKVNNVIITPHIAGATFESMLLTEEFVVEKFIKILDEKK